ncbi:MAG: allantoinase PuuE [Flavobacteriaceae bacterium]
MQDYPRDMRGYGRTPPDPKWPGDARIAVQFVVNYEEGGENCILHGDAASEAFLSEIVGAAPWPGMRHMNMESIYEYGARAGFWRLHRLFTRENVPVTVFGVATALQRSPEQVAAMREAGWEIASHGLKWIDYRDFDRKDEVDHMREACKIHEAVTGERPRGWYTGRSSAHTLDLAAENDDLLYTADSYADELPYWRDAGKRTHLVVPYTLDANDMRFATAQGFNAGEQFFAYLKDSLDVLYAEGGHGTPKMLSVGLHCRLAGRPGRFAALERFVGYIKQKPGVWLATREDIARHWHRTRPPRPLKPSRLGRASFVEIFGDIFEHSPWIAEAAHRGGLTAREDSAGGLHAAMAKALDAADAAAKRALIDAHPDLAGKLAVAGGLTADSSAEQASAGLDRLSPALFQRFTAANEAYRARFGFPFIMAVKGRSAAEILENFERRLNNGPEEEFATALSEISRIALLRLEARFSETDS